MLLYVISTKYFNNQIKFIALKQNQGYGHGIIQGLKIAEGDLLAWTHADMQTSPKDVLKGLEIIEKSKKLDRIYVKGVREGRNISDQFFSIGMAIIESIFLGEIFWDINAQPNIFSRDSYLSTNKSPVDAPIKTFRPHEVLGLCFLISSILSLVAPR